MLKSNNVEKKKKNQTNIAIKLILEDLHIALLHLNVNFVMILLLSYSTSNLSGDTKVHDAGIIAYVIAICRNLQEI